MISVPVPLLVVLALLAPAAFCAGRAAAWGKLASEWAKIAEAWMEVRDAASKWRKP